MPRSANEIHAKLRIRLDSIISATMRADPDAIDAVTAGLHQRLDRHSLDFLRHARRTLLAATVALSAVVDAHRPVPGPHGDNVCRNCGIKELCPTVRRVADTLAVYLTGAVLLDRSGAWRRADASLCVE